VLSSKRESGKMRKVMAYTVRSMKLGDVSQVVGIERESFPSPWSATNFRYELLFNRAAHYFVACGGLPEGDNISKGVPWLERVVSWPQRLVGRGRGTGNRWVLGYAGLWLTADEAHITTIAVRGDHRRQGLGEFLLLKIMEFAAMRNAQIVTLEVRPSSEAAQALYRKYGFVEVGVRHGYYYDTGEDALLMATERLSSASFQSQFQKLKQTYAERRGSPL
jgi:ribosomal-protein-alanine N-acetyltransferase